MTRSNSADRVCLDSSLGLLTPRFMLPNWLIVLFSLIFSVPALAEEDYKKYSTEFIAPKGIVAISLNFNQGRVSSFYDENGDEEKFGKDLTGIPLDFFGLPGDTTDVSLRYQTDLLEVTAGYGITDDISVGIQFLTGETCAEASIKTQNGFGDQLVASFTDQEGAFAYKDVDSNCENGVFAPVIGAAWRVYDGRYDSLVFIPGIRLGSLTDVYDPDKLFQPLIDDGANDIIIRFDYFRDLTYQLDIAAQFEYGINLKDKRKMRVPVSSLPITPKSFTEKLKRDVGDYSLLDIELGYRFLNRQARVYIAYYRKEKGEDDFSSPSGLSTEFLEENSDFRDEEYRIGFNWDGVPAWQAGKIPVPFKAEINFWESFKGKNYFKYYFTEFKLTLAF